MLVNVSIVQAQQTLDSAYLVLLKSTLNVISDSVVTGLDKRFKEIKAKDTEKRPQLLPEKERTEWFYKKFSLITLDKEGLVQGTSSTLKTSDEDTKLNLTLCKAFDRLIINGGTDIKVSDNVASIFSNTNPSADASYNVKLAYLTKSGVRYRLRRAGETQIHPRDYLEWYYKENIEYYRLGYRQKYANVIDSLRKNGVEIEKEKRKEKIDYNRIALLMESRTGFIKQLKDASLLMEDTDEPKTIAKRILDTLNSEASTTVLQNNGWVRYWMFWVNTNAGYTRDNYKLFDSLRMRKDLMFEKTFNRWSGEIYCNVLWQKNGWFQKNYATRLGKYVRSFYMSLGYKIQLDNNYRELDEQELSLLRLYESQNDSSYFIVSKEKIRDVSRTPFERSLLHSIVLQGALSPWNSEKVGINFMAKGNFSSSTIPTYDLKLGLLFRITDAKESKSKVNFELFAQANDITDAKAEKYNAMERISFGIGTTVPFNNILF